MALARSVAVARGMALAIAFLLVGVANGDLGHAFASRGAHSLGLALLAPDAAPDSAPQHNPPDCPLCRAARGSSVVLNAGAVGAPAVPESTRATPLFEALAPSGPQQRTETARSPPARLIV